MIHVTPIIAIEESSLQEEFVRSSGPGGQNVNKVSSAVVLRFQLEGSGLPPDVILRVKRLAGKKLTASGDILIKSQEHRTQEQNRVAARERLLEMLREAAVPPVVRRPTRPTRASRLRTLDAKKHRGLLKQARSKRPPLE